MKAVLKQIAPHLRALGFRGSGQNYRKTDGDFVFIVNFQGSSSGDTFYVNLGAQPVFIPSEGYVDLDKLKEYNCVFRRRVGDTWPWDMPLHGFEAFIQTLTTSQAAFFGHAQTLRQAIVTEPPDGLLGAFSAGQTKAVAALHLARAAAAVGQPEKARSLARSGLDLASNEATILRARLQDLVGPES